MDTTSQLDKRNEFWYFSMQYKMTAILVKHSITLGTPWKLRVDPSEDS